MIDTVVAGRAPSAITRQRGEGAAPIEECRRHPFKGAVTPEPLGGNLSGWWSRRISHEHRLVCRVAGSGDEQGLQVAQRRYHY